MVRDLMVKAVEQRFGDARAPHPVEWLSDNGSTYTARETATTAAALGLRLAFHPCPLAAEQWHLRGLRQNPEA